MRPSREFYLSPDSKAQLAGRGLAIRAVGCLEHLPQSGVVSVVDCRVEERPRLGVLQRYRHGRTRQPAKIGVFGRVVVVPARGSGEIDTPQAQHEVFEESAREAAFLPAAGSVVAAVVKIRSIEIGVSSVGVLSDPPEPTSCCR